MQAEPSIIYRKSPPLTDPSCPYPGFEPGTTILKKGSVVKEGHKPLECDIMFMRDVAIPVRDGTILYADIFRPMTEERVPALLNSTTFGKAKKPEANSAPPGSDPDFNKFSVPGVPKSWTSGLETFEGTDPGFFVAHDYAVVNLDIRGCNMSGGKNRYMGTQDAEDNYDVIEWLAQQDWCSGKVAMTGNSWLAITQGYAAALQPPHLTCFAPWEGWTDMYWDDFVVGGVPQFTTFRWNNAYKNDGEMEDVVANILAHPTYDEYWQDKHAHIENIHIPVYIVAGYISQIHTPGSFRMYKNIGTQDKWLRVHASHEWRDLYSRENEEDLVKFFDHFMKGVDNGWENTPRVRMSVLDPGGTDIVGRVEEEYPIPRTQLRELHLDAETMTMSPEPAEKEASVSYCSWDEKGMARFRVFFDEETEIVGPINVKLWVESDGYDDMDVFVKLSKIDADGNELMHRPIPGDKVMNYSGPYSRHRVSLRKVDPERSTPNEPYHPFDEVQKLRPHEIVPIEIGVYPCGLRFHPGQGLELVVTGFDYGSLHFAPGKMKFGWDNNGYHVIHTGGKYDSRLVVPFVPIVE